MKSDALVQIKSQLTRDQIKALEAAVKIWKQKRGSK